MPIVTTPDHVAIAVPTIEAAAIRWRDQLGGGWLLPREVSEEAGFASRQLRFAGGTKLELLQPLGPETFAARFLARFGATIHHVTLKVPELAPAIEEVRTAGYDVVDVAEFGDLWHEGFLRPSQVGGMIVQLAWSGRTDEEWVALSGGTPEVPAPSGAMLLGPTLRHPDLDAAARLWTTLGATVRRTGGHEPTANLEVSWPSAPLTVRIEHGDEAGPVGLRFEGAGSLAADPRFGPAVLAT